MTYPSATPEIRTPGYNKAPTDTLAYLRGGLEPILFTKTVQMGSEPPILFRIPRPNENISRLRANISRPGWQDLNRYLLPGRVANFVFRRFFNLFMCFGMFFDVFEFFGQHQSFWTVLVNKMGCSDPIWTVLVNKMGSKPPPRYARVYKSTEMFRKLDSGWEPLGVPAFLHLVRRNAETPCWASLAGRNARNPCQASPHSTKVGQIGHHYTGHHWLRSTHLSPDCDI